MTDRDPLNTLKYLVRNPDNKFYPINDPECKPDTTGLSTQWEKTTASGKVATVNKIVSADHSLQAAWATLKASVDTSNPAVAAAYRDVEAGLKGVHSGLSTMAKTQYFNYQHGPGATTAEIFFAVVEMSERVLLNLSIADVLATTTVNKTLHRTIHGSPRLQKHLHLSPEPGAVFRSLDFTPRLQLHYGHREGERASLPNLDITIDESYKSRIYDRCTKRPTLKIEMRRTVYDWPGESYGARIAKMLVCQPPVMVMDVSVDCCGSSSVTVAHGYDGMGYDDEPPRVQARPQSEAEFDKVTSATGITVGDLLAACKSLAKQHHMCPGAREPQLDNRGLAWPDFRFEAVAPAGCEVPDRDRDHDRLSGPESPRPERERTSGGGKLRGYVAARRIAGRSRVPVPTLEEFKAYASFGDWEVGVGLKKEGERDNEDRGAWAWPGDDY